jgi:beta-galactosidase
MNNNNVKMKQIVALFAALLMAVTTFGADKGIIRKRLFDADWQFFKDSTTWRTVNLPHDWSIEGDFDKDALAGHDGAYLPTGKGWYRKQFKVLSEESAPSGRAESLKFKDQKLRLYFEGVYMNAEVYVNGQKAGGHPYGYSSFFVDITPYAKIGQNEIEVRVDNSQQKNCRWYSGSGIYRHVWLLTTPKRYIDEWSVSVATPDIHTVEIKAEVVMEDGSRKPIEKTIHVDNPHLWSPDDPFLYHTTIEGEGDVVPVTYGIRTIEYSAEEGLLLNGKPIVLNGGCVHHDNGILGARAFDAAEYRRVRLLKESGFNAIRTSHNPPSETFLRACDELGLLVIDEAFDGWRDKKNTYDYSTLIDKWWQEDIKAMVLRDRNHPSVFCWSTGNEVIERKKIEVVKTAHNLNTLCRQLDPQKRPVTSALCAWDPEWDIYDPLAAEHDIVGYNYMIHKSQSDHERVPNRVMVQTESYSRDTWRNYRKVQDEPWVIGDFVWTAIDYLGESGIGRWYYEGEPAKEPWEAPMFPNHAAYCGDIDLIGQRKPISHYRSMLWNKDGEQLYMAVREPDGYYGKIKTTMWSVWPTYESWTWPGHEGKNIDVEVYSHYPNGRQTESHQASLNGRGATDEGNAKVRLYLNDQLVGEKEVAQGMATFTLPYQPGTLRAERLRVGDGTSGMGGEEKVSLKTADEAKTIRLTTDRTTLKADGQDLAFITVELTDADGIVNLTANNELTASVSGPVTLIGFGNADIKDCNRYTDNTHKAWKGRSLLVVRSTGKKGKATITVQGKGLKTARVNLSFNYTE